MDVLDVWPERVPYNVVVVPPCAGRLPETLSRPLAEAVSNNVLALVPLCERACSGEAVQVARQRAREPQGRQSVRCGPHLHARRSWCGDGHARDRHRSGCAQGEARLRESEGRFQAIVHAGSNAVSHMGPEWAELSGPDSQGFLANTAASMGA